MKFGTSGLRGLVSEMTDPVCAAYVVAYLRHLKQGAEATVLIGRDLRPSSPRIATACARGVATVGAQAADCGVVPTPALALAAMQRRVSAVMVSGSHIPFDRNGLKFYGPNGEITKDDEAGILAALDRAANDLHEMEAGPRLRIDASVGGDYVARGVDYFGRGRLVGLRVGVWQHSAAGRDLLVAALEALGAAVVPLGRTDDFVPIDTEAVAPEDQARIRTWVLEHRLDALVSTDGDGDRPLIADETGAVLRGDAVGTLAARRLGADAVATPLNSSTALERSEWFPRIVRTRIGSPFVIAGLDELAGGGAVLPVGYEANGGFLVGSAVQGSDGRTLSALPTRDALVPILALLTATQPLSALVATLPRRVTASGRLQDVPEAHSEALLARLISHSTERQSLLSGVGEIVAVNTIDALRMTLDTGDIVHLRRSGNAPELRVYTEATEADRASALLSEMLDRVGAALNLSSGRP